MRLSLSNCVRNHNRDMTEISSEVMTELAGLVEILHREECSCVIGKGENVCMCRQRGVKDLYDLLQGSSGILSGALVADKVIGKGAAALMILGGITAVYGDVISEGAYKLLRDADVPVSYGEITPNIINRAGTGICPVEALCKDCDTAAACLPKIEDFIRSIA